MKNIEWIHRSIAILNRGTFSIKIAGSHPKEHQYPRPHVYLIEKRFHKMSGKTVFKTIDDR